MSQVEYIRRFVQMKPNWKTEDEIVLNFPTFDRRTMKNFLDILYCCGPETLETEDLLKLLLVVNAHGPNKLWDKSSVKLRFFSIDQKPW